MTGLSTIRYLAHDRESADAMSAMRDGSTPPCQTKFARRLAVLITLAASMVLVQPAVTAGNKSSRSGPSSLPTTHEELEALANRRLTLSGAVVAFGTGVDCPKIRASSGQTYAVSHLPTSLKIGTRVKFRGAIGFMPTCKGPIIRVEGPFEIISRP